MEDNNYPNNQNNVNVAPVEQPIQAPPGTPPGNVYYGSSYSEQTQKRPTKRYLMIFALVIIAVILLMVALVRFMPSPLEQVQFENDEGSTIEMSFYPVSRVIAYEELGTIAWTLSQNEDSDLGVFNPKSKILTAPLPYNDDLLLTFGLHSTEMTSENPPEPETCDTSRYEVSEKFQSKRNSILCVVATGQNTDNPIYLIYLFEIDNKYYSAHITLDFDSKRIDDQSYLARASNAIDNDGMRMNEIEQILTSIELQDNQE